jgi:hypothetical protein
MSELTNKIRNHEILREYLADHCRENSAEVQISDKIKDYCIVNPEQYYRDQHLSSTPASVDFIVTSACRKHSHDQNLIELKSTSKSLRGEDSQIFKKFEDTLDKFIFGTFNELYNLEGKSYLRLILVHDIKMNSELLYLSKLFSKPVKKQNRNMYIENYNSPFKLEKC